MIDTILQTPKRVSLHTLGCKLNYAETSTIAAQFLARGYELTPFGDPTDVLLLNTCSVTENAEKECRQLVRRTLRSSPNAFVAVTGCYAQLRPEEIASIEGVDVVLGAKEKFQIFDHVSDLAKFTDGPRIFSSEIGDATDFTIAATAEGDGRTRAFLKVQDGCDYSCSFCTIPLARGASRSADVDAIVRESTALSDRGFREIVLSGVNVGDFGTKTGSSFLELIQALEAEPMVTARMRISSIEPNLLTDEIIRFVATSSKFCPHFHIPLQSGSPRILKLMRRRYVRELYLQRVEAIKSVMPHAAIGVDVIVGFPGEGEEEFRETYDFLNDLDVTYFHVFTYSERPDTPAATISDIVPVHLRKERNHKLRILSEKKRMAFYASQFGRELTVLVEGKEMTCATEATDAHWEGFSENYVRVRIPQVLPQGAELVRVTAGSLNGDVVIGESPVPLLLRSERTLLPIL